MRKDFQITEYRQNFMKDYIGEGDLCIDATAGNGGDTEFLLQDGRRKRTGLCL